MKLQYTVDAQRAKHNIMKKILILFLLSVTFAYGQKIKYTVDANGVHIDGVTASNSVMYLNDMIKDTPELFYLWLKANRKEVNLVGNISDHNSYPGLNSSNKPNETQPVLFQEFNKMYSAFTLMGGKNVPAPILGSSKNMVSGQTTWENSPGADLIISEAKKASPDKPLVLFVGGSVTTVANAYLKDKSIRDNIIVFQTDGWGVSNYNCYGDSWAPQVLIDGGVKYVNWDGNLNSWYYLAGSPNYRGTSNDGPGNPINRMPGMTFTTINNAFHNAYKSNFQYMYEQTGNVGDGPPVFWFFNNSLWQNVARKNKSNQTVTDNNFAFLLVSQNNWNGYCPQLSAYMNNPANYVAVTTTPPPVNQAPSVTTTMGALFNAGPVTLTASASDSDGTVSKVEFLVNGSKVGEDLSSPYSLVQTLVPGSYGIQAKATDNLGAAGNSPTLIITVVGVTQPPTDSTDCIVCPSGPIGPQGAKGDQGDKGDQGEPGPQGPPGSGTGTGSVLRTVFNVETYGANGADNAPDTKGFQDAINAAIAVNGLVWWPAAQNYWNIDNTLQIVPRSGTSQCWIDIYGQGSVQQMRWTGGNNKPVFRIVGLKNGSIEGVKISLSGTGVTAFDIVTTATSNSSTSVKFENFRINLGDGIDNIGVRMGEENGGNGDISHYTFISGGVYGGGALKGQGNPILGQYAFVNYGHNTLANTFVNCFVAQTDRFYTNISRDGSKRGNSSVTFFGCGGAHVGDLFVTAWQGQYSVIGGRFENGHRTFFKVAPNGGYQHITILGPEVKDFGAPGGTIIDIQQACSFKLENVVLTNGRSDTKFTNPIKLSSNGRIGNLDISGGGILSDATFPYTKTGTTQWNITVNGVARMGDSKENGNIYSTTFFNNEFGVRK